MSEYIKPFLARPGLPSERPGGMCSYFGSAVCGGMNGEPECEFASQIPKGCDRHCEECELPCPCKRAVERGDRSAYEAKHGVSRAGIPARKIKLPREGLYRTCVYCGGPFRARYVRSPQKHCNKECYNAARGEGMNKICENCGEPYRAKNRNQKYCHPECCWEARRKHD